MHKLFAITLYIRIPYTYARIQTCTYPCMQTQSFNKFTNLNTKTKVQTPKRYYITLLNFLLTTSIPTQHSLNYFNTKMPQNLQHSSAYLF